MSSILSNVPLHIYNVYHINNKVLVTFNWSPSTVFYRYLSIGSSNKKIQNTRCIFFKFCFWEDPPHPVNWSPTHSTGPKTPFFTYISVSVAQIKKLKKQGAFFLLHILLLGGHSPPSQLVPNPFAWSPTLFFLQISR